MSSSSPKPPNADCQFLIAGGGIVGLVLALALKLDLGVTAHIYEAANGFADDVGAGMGMYPNGLRVIRHLGDDLLRDIQAAGYPYQVRRYERHDGTSVVVAEETKVNDGDLQSMGIRRCRLQKVLYEAVQAANIPIYFSKRIESVQETNNGSLIRVVFTDGTVRHAEFVFGADGSKSQVRAQVLQWNQPTHSTDKDPVVHQLKYTGVTCLMGMASLPRPQRGICFPSSLTTKCHAVFFPTAAQEQCFQIHFPVLDQEKAAGSWGPLMLDEAKLECSQLADQLEQDGWHADYLGPLRSVTHAVRIGFCLLQPRLQRWVYGTRSRVILLGDAAHPPVPYLGQGAQLGLEDAGTLSLLLQRMCLDVDGKFQTVNFAAAARIWEQMRIPRTTKILDNSKFWGKVQQQRANLDYHNKARETLIRRDVFFHDALPILFPGAQYDYQEAVERVLENKAVQLPMVQEED